MPICRAHQALWRCDAECGTSQCRNIVGRRCYTGVSSAHQHAVQRMVLSAPRAPKLDRIRRRREESCEYRRDVCTSVLGISLLVWPKTTIRVMYNIDMPNMCFKHVNNMQTHWPFKFSRRQIIPDPRIDHSPSRFPMALKTLHHFIVFHRW